MFVAFSILSRSFLNPGTRSAAACRLSLECLTDCHLIRVVFQKTPGSLFVSYVAMYVCFLDPFSILRTRSAAACRLLLECLTDCHLIRVVFQKAPGSLFVSYVSMYVCFLDPFSILEQGLLPLAASRLDF
jgi:hypothetical protein